MCGSVGLLIRRWWALAVPISLWAAIAVFLVINDGWYGHGWGDGGVLLDVVVAGLSVLLTAAGIAVRRIAARGRRLA